MLKTLYTLAEVRMLYTRWQDLREIYPRSGITWQQVQAAKELFEQALATLEEDNHA